MKPLHMLACPSCGYPVRASNLKGVQVLRCTNCGLTSPDLPTSEVSGYADEQVQRRLRSLSHATADHESEDGP